MIDDVAGGGRAQMGGEPDLIQLMTPEGVRLDSGQLAAHPLTEEAAQIAENVTGEQFLGWYRDMVMTRRMDAEATNLQRHGELGLWAPLLGQEAAQVGAGRSLRKQDFAFPTYREHAVAWCRNVDPIHSLRMFRGTTLGAWDPHEYNFHLYTIVIGSQCLHATGYAMGVQRDGCVGTGEADRDAAVMAFFGDGASAQGDVSESLVYAGVNNAPVVFFCQNNQWAISEPNTRQIRGPLYRRAGGFGFPGLRVDGNDVLATYAVTSAMMNRARSGQGPALIEAYTYRMGAHTTTDDPTRYRSSAEVEAWKAKDPIARLKAYLEAQGLPGEGFFEQIEEEADQKATELRETCRSLPNPDPSTIFDHVYRDPHPQVATERAEFEAYHASFSDV